MKQCFSFSLEEVCHLLLDELVKSGKIPRTTSGTYLRVHVEGGVLRFVLTPGDEGKDKGVEGNGPSRRLR